MKNNKELMSVYYYTIALIIGLTGYYFTTTTFIYKYGIHIFFVLVEISYIMMVMKILLLDKSLNKKIIFILFSIIFYISSIYSGDNKLLILLAFILASENISFKYILKIYFVTIIPELVFTIVCSLHGIIKNLVYFRGIGKVSYAFGSVYVTNFCAHIFYLVLAYVVIKKFNINFIEKLLITCIGLFVLFGEAVRLDGILILVIVIFTIFPNIYRNLDKLNIKFILFLELILSSAMIVLSYYYSATSKITIVLDRLLSNRLSQGKQAFLEYPIKLLGQSIKMQGLGGETGAMHAYKDYFYIDSSFVQLFFINGIVNFIIVIVITCVCTYNFYKNKKYILILPIILIYISSMIDDLLLNVSYNIFLLSLIANTDTFFIEKENLKKKRLYFKL